MIIIIIDFNYFLLHLFENLNPVYVRINIISIVMIPIVFMRILFVMVLLNVVRNLMKIIVKIKNLMDYQFIINQSIIYYFML